MVIMGDPIRLKYVNSYCVVIVLLLSCDCYCFVVFVLGSLARGLWSMIVAFPGRTHLLLLGQSQQMSSVFLVC